MSIPAIGLCLLWLGFCLFVIKPQSLLHAAVFLSFFENTAILVRQSPAGIYGLPAWTYFLFLAGAAKLARSRGKHRGGAGVRHLPALTRSVSLFAFACIASLIVPLYIDGRYSVPSPSLGEQGLLRPVVLDASNFLTAVPFLAALGMAVMIWRECTEWRQVTAFLRTIVSAVAGVALLGLWELADITLGLPYPQQFFRSLEPNRIEGVLGSTGVVRLSSVAGEPSQLARVLLVGLCLLVLCRWRNIVLLGRFRDRLALLLILAILLLSASSSALLGLSALVVLGALVALFTARSGLVARLKVLASVAGFLGAASLAYQQLPVVRAVFAVLVTTKSVSDSYLERTRATSNAFHTFLDFPWLGVGLGESASYDLPAKMLSNVGLIGTAFFVAMMWQTAHGLWGVPAGAASADEKPARQTISRALLVALAVQLVVDGISGFYFEAAYFWVLCGVCWASFSVAPAIPQEGVTVRRGQSSTGSSAARPRPDTGAKRT